MEVTEVQVQLDKMKAETKVRLACIALITIDTCEALGAVSGPRDKKRVFGVKIALFPRIKTKTPGVGTLHLAPL